MTHIQKIFLALLRVSLGWLFFYAGITKVMDSKFSAAGYLEAAKSLPDLFHWFADPTVLPVINFLVKWGLTLIGVTLILGLFVRLSSILGIAMMILFYIPILNFPYPNTHSFIVDEHIIYSSALLVLLAFNAGHYYGLDAWCVNLPICSKYPNLRKLIG